MKGHFVEIITNMTITNMVDKFMEWPREELGQSFPGYDSDTLTISLTNNYRLTNKYRCKLIGYDGKILYSSSCGIYKIDMEELETPIM